MTLEEAKKLLKKEFATIGFHKCAEPYEFGKKDWFDEEKPEVLEAFCVLGKESMYATVPNIEYMERKKRLKKEFEENTTDSNYKINPELVDAAKEFNDALLDEQAKKIKQFEDFCASRNKIIVQQSEKISSLNKKITKKNKVISKKSRMIKDKDAVLADVAEELRLSKVREENLTSTCQKYLKEIEELEKKANKYANVLADLSDKLRQTKFELTNAKSSNAYLDMLRNVKHALVEKDAIIQEKDEVIEDLGKELKAQKDLVDDISLRYDGAKYNLDRRIEECTNLKKQLYDALKISDEPCGEPKKSINTGDYISKEELMKIQEKDVRKITTPPFSPISEMRKGNGILDQMVVSADLGKGESKTSRVIVIQKDADPTLLRNIFKDMSVKKMPSDISQWVDKNF